MTPSPLETKLQELERLANASGLIGADGERARKEYARLVEPAYIRVLVKDIRTALQDERGRAREAAIDEAVKTAELATVNIEYGNGSIKSEKFFWCKACQSGRWENEPEEEWPLHQPYCAVTAIRALKPQSPPGEAQGWPALDDDLREILGRPNFACGRIAQAFRQFGGADIRTKAEDEQAFVIHWLTGLYLKHGKEWRKYAAEELPLPAPPVTTETEKNNDA